MTTVRDAIVKAMKAESKAKPSPAAPPNPLQFTDPRAFAEFVALGDYLEATPRDRRPPIQQLLKHVHPEARQAALTRLNLLDAGDRGGAAVPFGPRYTLDQVAEALDLPAKLAREVHQQAWDQDIAEGLQQRMGTDADRSPDTSPPTCREQIEAAYDVHAANPEE